MEGLLLGGRYELIEKIGGGGMAQVFKAKDLLLNRFVAVKILRQEFVDDEEFVRRFKVEAQSSAGLSHPNIVSIYDVGQDGTVQYIVMEYIDGITLKEYIAHKGFLQWGEAVNIAIQIASALDHAHRNHIIHRDIKPQNILMTNTLIAKVTDFGIARAVSASTITLAGNTIGSVHYFSPEQARGGFVDEKSDLYSIGITLYEMVTGKMPFDGDTPVSVALKHIQDNPVSPIVLNRSIPAGVNDIIMKAIKKDQNARYQKASDFLNDLYRVLKQPEGGFVGENAVQGVSTKRVSAVDEKIAVENGIEKKPAKKKEKLKYWLVGTGAVLLIFLIGFASFNIVTMVVSPGGEYVVEDFVGKDISEAQRVLTNQSIMYNVKYEFSSNIAKNIVISQDKDVGDTLIKGGYEKISFVVSNGVNLIKMPDYATQDPRIAVEDLANLGVNKDNITQKEVFSDEIEEGMIVDTDPKADTEFTLTDKITINVSKGPEIKKVKVPNLVGKTYAQAQQLLQKSKFAIGNLYPEDGNYNDIIVKQSPAAGAQAKEGSAVSIYFQSKAKNVTWVVNLKNPGNYTDPLNITLVITPSDTGVSKTIYSQVKNKADFPLSFSIPVPAGGSTLAQVFINNVLYSSITEK